MHSTTLVRSLIAFSLVLVAACGGGSGDGGSTTTSALIEAVSFEEIAEVLAAGGLVCEPLLQSSGSLVGDEPTATCGTTSGSISLALWPEGIDADGMEAFARSTLCSRVSAWMYVDVVSWTAQPPVVNNAQDQALLDAIVAASGGTIVSVPCS
ncbi:MAG: hypothetical protein WD184_10930 [Acidimicrobiia bacterium]